MTDLPFDILDHIFGLLRSDPRSLIACSKAHPDFTPIAERYRYYHSIINTGHTDFPYSFKPRRLIKLISATPRIVNHVRVLQIEFNPRFRRSDWINPFLEDIAWLFPRFPVIECLILSTEVTCLSWEYLPHNFRTAVEDCLCLPTLQEVHVIGSLRFPLSILKHTDINLLSLVGSPTIVIFEDPDATYLQLKSLQVRGLYYSQYGRSFITWANLHIGKLQSLEFDYFDDPICLDLLKGCSDTLENLYITLEPCHYNNMYMIGHENGIVTSINLSSLCHLQCLTISALFQDLTFPDSHFFFSAVIEIVKTASSLQHLNIGIFNYGLDLDFSPLVALESCASFHRIDLYFCSRDTIASPISLLADYKGLMDLIDQGTLVIHIDEATSTFLDTVHSRSTVVQHPSLYSSLP